MTKTTTTTATTTKTIRTTTPKEKNTTSLERNGNSFSRFESVEIGRGFHAEEAAIDMHKM
jgi:hypothetical protein